MATKHHNYDRKDSMMPKKDKETWIATLVRGMRLIRSCFSILFGQQDYYGIRIVMVY